MPRNTLVLAVGAFLTAMSAVAAPPDMSGAWSLGRVGAKQPGAKALVIIEQTPETVSFAFGAERRAAMTIATDGTPRPLTINGAPTTTTISARWDGPDLVVDLTPGQAGSPLIRNVWRRVDETTLRVSGGWPLPGRPSSVREIELKRVDPAEVNR